MDARIAAIQTDSTQRQKHAQQLFASRQTEDGLPSYNMHYNITLEETHTNDRLH